MNSNRHPKKSALVRFFRGVLRLFKVLFAPKRKSLKSETDYEQELRVAELERRQREAEAREIEARQEQLITVGELFDRVKWQVPSSATLLKPLDLGMTTRGRDVSRN
jgi:Tfp pilus assembly protein PilO